MNLGALFVQTGKNLQCRRLAHVIGIALVSDAQGQNLGAVQTFAPLIESVADAANDKCRHLAVDMSCELDQARLATLHARLPGQVVGTDGDALTAQSGARIEWHITEWF